MNLKMLLDRWPLESAIGSAIVLILLWLCMFPPLEVILFRFSAFWWSAAEAVRDFKRRRRELRKEAAAVAGWKQEEKGDTNAGNASQPANA